MKNKQLFKLMEIVGIIGLDVELKGDDEQALGLRLIETLIKNAHLAQNQIEELLKDLTGIDTSEPMGLLKAVTAVKNDKDVLNFFTEVFKFLQ